MSQSTKKRWSLDKHIPVALIVTLLVSFIVQTFLLGWYISSQDSRVTVAEEKINALDKKGRGRDILADEIVKQLSQIDKQVAIIAERLAALMDEKKR